MSRRARVHPLGPGKDRFRVNPSITEPTFNDHDNCPVDAPPVYSGRSHKAPIQIIMAILYGHCRYGSLSMMVPVWSHYESYQAISEIGSCLIPEVVETFNRGIMKCQPDFG